MECDFCSSSQLELVIDHETTQHRVWKCLACEQLTIRIATCECGYSLLKPDPNGEEMQQLCPKCSRVHHITMKEKK